jgi:hypothetical protein
MKTKAKPASTAAEKTSKTTTASHKLGSKRNESAARPRVLDKNFKQSRDVREDRGTRQMKSGPKNRGK